MYTSYLLEHYFMACHVSLRGAQQSITYVCRTIVPSCPATSQDALQESSTPEAGLKPGIRCSDQHCLAPLQQCHRLLLLRVLFFTSTSWGECSRMWCLAWVGLYSA